MIDLSLTIAPKSVQLTAADLLAGRRSSRLTCIRGCDDPGRPGAIHFEGENKTPYKPCKSVRRGLVNAWGADGTAYVGRSLTLYRDEGVQFGGIKVGGIRISHMSHIERDVTMALTATRAKRTPYTVRPLGALGGQRGQTNDDAIKPTVPASEVPLSERIAQFMKRIGDAPNRIKADAMWKAAERLRNDVDAADPERLIDMQEAYDRRCAELEDQERGA